MNFGDVPTGWIGKNGAWYPCPFGDHIKVAETTVPGWNKPMVHMGQDDALFDNDCGNLYLSKAQVKTLFAWCSHFGHKFEDVTSPIEYLIKE